MRKSVELVSPDGCWCRAIPGEMRFVLLGRDIAAPKAIAAWVSDRRRRTGSPEVAKRDQPQLDEAIDCAHHMKAERESVIARLNAANVERVGKDRTLEREAEYQANLALSDELMFVLLGRDLSAPAAIHAWIDERQRLGRNELETDVLTLKLARECIERMDRDREGIRQQLAAQKRLPVEPVLEGLNAWLLSCDGVVSSQLVLVTISNKQYHGAYYVRRSAYGPNERAVTSGQVKAGELYDEPSLYLLGEAPIKPIRNCFVWKNSFPFDERVHRESGDWYVACYAPRSAVEDPRTKPYHPFGVSFQLRQWPIMTYGPYKDHLIDTLEPRTYRRTPMQVDYLGEQEVKASE